MKLKETPVEQNETQGNVPPEYNPEQGPVDVSAGMNSNQYVNSANPDGLDGYYNPGNAGVGSSGFYGSNSTIQNPSQYGGGTSQYYGNAGGQYPGSQNLEGQYQGNGYSYGGYSGDPGHSQGFFDAPPEEPQRKLTKPEFYAREGNRKQRDRITISSVVIYVTAIIGIFAADFLVKTIESLNDMIVAMGGEPYDVSGYMSSQIFVSIVMIGLGIGIQLFKSRVCAIIGLVGSAINVLATLVTYHKFGGYYVFLAFCYATAATFALAKRWDEYDKTGKCRGVI